VSFPHQTIDTSRGQRSSNVQNLVGFFERSHSTNSSSVSQSMQSNNQIGGYDEESSFAQSSSATHAFNEAIPQAMDSRDSGLTPIHRHRSAYRAIDGLRHLQTDSQQGLQAVINDSGHVPKPLLDPKAPAQLSGYLQEILPGQMVLVCPLSDADKWRYMDQAFIQVIDTPATGLVPSMMIQQPYDTNNSGPSTLTVPQQEPTFPSAATTTIPGWSNVQPSVTSPNLASFSSHTMHNAGRNRVPAASIARGQSSLNNIFFDISDFVLPSFHPRLI
jgi:hypothetical protein